MTLPSTRELELEALVRQRDEQISELNDDITRLRRYISSQNAPSFSDPITLPPSILSILGQQLRSSAKDSAPGSSTVINALIQRSRLLQEENDELYEILKLKETGKLKEEVRGLRKVVQRLESGLRESHQVITTLSTELDKTHEALLASSKHVSPVPPPSDLRNASRSPRNTFRELAPTNSSVIGNGPQRLPPTGPRAFKKARLSDSHSQASPPPSRPPPSTSHRQHGTSSNHPDSTNRSADRGGSEHHHYSRDRPRHSSAAYSSDKDRERDNGAGLPSKPPPPSHRPSSNKMDVDDDKRERRPRPASGPADRERNRQRGDTSSNVGGDNSVVRDSYEKDRAPRDREREHGGGGGGKERGRDRGGSGRDRERNDTNATNRGGQGNGGGGRRNGGPFPGNNYGGGRGNNGQGHHRRTNNDHRTSGAGLSSARDSNAIDRTLAERMGL
ncbi:hypothetical protein CC1G_00408 [Coprinopsis cinerea okayama7|uniref:Uncharacterized protein n=1 Tax=Coprinopsis cinerea (strain Okayama-7 / 130 / ATCC MYA-4618 / FGSC 9003) TaxID=240176 RepID=A8NXU7_COPC7|nr:hypothetical protein CC1G_00408 [Coprinopsis cinerea okayama7\|eukprot:XP_001837272.1 hypothetical protein CC1G_00408 [Coprinopsis cinerea okayama7\